MKNYKKHVDDFFREKAGRVNETPPPDVWEDLDKQLDGELTTSPTTSYRWLQYFGAVSLVLLLFVSVIMKISGNSANDVKNTPVVTKTIDKSQENSSSQSEHTSIAKATDNNANNATTNETSKEGKIVAKNDQANVKDNTQDNKVVDQHSGAVNTPSSGNVVAASKTLKQTNPTDKIVSPGKVASAKNKVPVRPATAGNDENGNKEKYAKNSKAKENKNISPAKITSVKNKFPVRPSMAGNNDQKENKEIYAANDKQEKTNIAAEIKSNEKKETFAAKTGTNENKENTANTTTQPGHNYAGSNNNNDNKTVTTSPLSNNAASTNKQMPAAHNVIKKDSVKTTITKKKNKSDKPQFKKLEEGVKAGYERGTNNYAASKYTISPYLQFNLSQKLSIMLQPAMKYAKVATRNIGTAQSYYNVNPDWTFNQDGNSTQNISGTDTTYTTKYTYTETHDSIVKSYVVGGTYMEFELPILLKYKLAKKLSVYGGVNLVYSKLTAITERTYTRQSILKSVDFTDVTPTLPATLPASPDISYTGLPFSNYTGPLFQSSQSSQLLVGYMIGFSYECGQRLLFDLLMEQNPLNPNVKGGYNVNAPLSATYFRISIGYRLKNNWRPFGSGWGHTDYGRGD